MAIEPKANILLSLAAVVLALGALSGCAMPQASANETRYYRVDSDPPGARVVNVATGMLMCNAPCLMSQINYWGNTPAIVKLKALPTRAQDCAQTEDVLISNMSLDPKQAPTVFFSMKSCSVNRNLNGTMDGN